MAKHQSIHADLLRRRFLSRETTLQVAHLLHLSEDQTNRRQREAIDALAQLIRGREISMRNERRESMLTHMLPRSYSKFVWQEDHLQLLLKALRKPDPPLVMALVGIGGIDKTALADRLARTLISEFVFRDLHWISSATAIITRELDTPLRQWDNIISHLAYSLTGESKARNQNETLIRRRLKEESMLIVIDGFDINAIEEAVIERLRDLAETSKFLLACRIRPSSEVGVFEILVPELDLGEAGALLKTIAMSLGLDERVFEQGEIAKNFFSLLGGHTGALKLAAKKLASLPASAVQARFEMGMGDDVETFYREIYERTWKKLSSKAQKILKVLIGGKGINLTEMQSAAKLSLSNCEVTVAELMDNALLKREGSFSEPRYRIHQLTETFLKSELLEHL